MAAPPNNNLAGQLNISKFPLNSKISYELDHKAEWIAALLAEMNEHSELPAQALLHSTHLNLRIDIIKRFKGEMGEFLLAKGSLESEYATRCVRTLRHMKEKIKIDFKACFMDEGFAKKEEYADLDEVFQDGEVYELYYYNRKMVDLQEMLHEQIYLNYNAYPILEEVQENDESTEPDDSLQ